MQFPIGSDHFEDIGCHSLPDGTRATCLSIWTVCYKYVFIIIYIVPTLENTVDELFLPYSVRQTYPFSLIK